MVYFNMSILYNNDMDELDENIYTVAEFAKKTKTDRRTVINWIKKGIILAFRLSDNAKSHYRIKGSEVDRLISYQLQKENIKH